MLNYEMVERAQNGDQEAMLELLKKFKPFLKRNAKKLDCENAYEEFLVSFIGVIRRIKLEKMRSLDDGAITTYITTSAGHDFGEIFQRHNNEVKTIAFSQLEEWQIPAAEDQTSVDDRLSIDLSKMKPILTGLEYEVIYDRFILGYTGIKIAQLLGTTGSNISQIKKSALKKLKDSMLGK